MNDNNRKIELGKKERLKGRKILILIAKLLHKGILDLIFLQTKEWYA